MEHEPYPYDKTRCADNIFSSFNVDEIKTAVSSLIQCAEGVSASELWGLCRNFENLFSEWQKQYRLPHKTSTWNAVIIPPEHAHIMLLSSCVPFGSSPNEIIAGLRNFLVRCDEFIPPKFEAITNTEIKCVLTAAQKSYRLIDIIAPQEPMKILRFDYSHVKHNSQCGIPDNPVKVAPIFLFHPNENDMCDRVFIFAHELGHALHFALTHDVNMLPDGFEAFNQKLGVKFVNINEYQEAFADSTALAILNAKGLRTHFPTEWGKAMSVSHANYIRELCTNALQTAGKLSEPLPPPYSSLNKLLSEFSHRSGVTESELNNSANN
jgi:hypothetical protein